MEDYAGKICPVCKREIKSFEKVKICSECGIPHHLKCWEENAGCSTFGCGQQGTYKKSISTTPSIGNGKKLCPKCGAELDEDSRFCVSCGANIEESSYEKPLNSVSRNHSTDYRQSFDTNSVAPPIDKKNNVIGNIISIIVSLALIAIGVIRIVTAGTSISSTSFGGDFYTYTYKGIVAISEILSSVEVTLGWVIIAIGASIGVKVFRD